MLSLPANEIALSELNMFAPFELKTERSVHIVTKGVLYTFFILITSAEMVSNPHDKIALL